MQNRHLLLAVILVFFIIDCSWAQQKDELRPLITVTGSSEVKVVPDLVDLQVGLETRSKDLKAAFSDQEAKVRQILDLMRRAGVENRDVQTGHVEVRPVYDEEKGGKNLNHYELRKSIGITVRDPSKYDELLPELLQAGANRVFGVSFRSSKQRQYRDQAREMAVTAAREKATAIAEKLGQQIGKVFTIEEEEPVRLAFGNMTANSTGEASGTERDVTDSGLALGQITFRASIKISFELK